MTSPDILVPCKGRKKVAKVGGGGGGGGGSDL